MSKRLPRGSLPWAAAFLLACVCALVPFAPGLPAVGLDNSWAIAMNQAVAQGLVFGRDLVFTFGPYASIYTHMFHPATDARMLWGSLVLAFALAALLSLLLRSGWRARVALLLILSGLLYSRDALYVFYMVGAGALCERLGSPAGDARGPRDARNAAILGLLFAPLGLLPLVKGSMLALAVLIAVLACLLCLLRRQWWSAAAVVAGPVVGLLVAWGAAGQPWDALHDYLASMLPIVSGYTEAMSARGQPREILLYLVASVALVCRLARRDAPASEKLLLALMFAAGLFLAFKGGFVRHDGHAGMAGLFLLLACCILPWPQGRAANYVTVALVLVAWGVIDRQYFHSNPARIAQQVKRTYVEAWSGLRQRLEDPHAYAAAYGATLAQLATRSAFGKLAGSTDIYSHAQVELIASGNTWNPRPVLQSYSAYTPELAERDRLHLAGPGAPDQVVFRVEALDDRLPAQEDGPSWPELLARYEPADLQADALLLRRRAIPLPLADCGVRSGRHVLGETVPLPAGDCAAFVRFDLRPSALGKLAGLLYKPSQLQVRLQLADGSQRDYRLVSGMARAGLLLSPLVENTLDFGLLYAGAGELRSREVRSLTVTARQPWMWQDSYGVEMRGLRLPPAPAVLRLYREPPAQPAGGRDVAPSADCKGSLDMINGMLSSQHLSVGRLLTAQGWVGTAHGTSPQRVFLVLTDEDGKRFLVPARRTPRPDVAAVFGQRGLVDSGFVATASVAGLRGAFHFTVGYEDQGRVLTCPQVDREATLAGGAP